MKVGFRQLCLLSLKNVLLFGTGGITGQIFISTPMYLNFWNPCQSWGFAAVERAKQGGYLFGCKEQQEQFKQQHPRGKKGRGKKHLGLCKSKGETQVESLRTSWEGWPPEEGEDWEGNGKAELLMWSWENTGRRTHGMWGGPCRGGVHIATVSHTALKPENQDAGKGWRCPSQRTAVVTLILPETCWSFGEGCAQKYQQLILHFSR